MRVHVASIGILCVLVGCDEGRDGGMDSSPTTVISVSGTGGNDSNTTGDNDNDDNDSDSDETRLDVGSGAETDGVDCGEGEDCPDACEDYEHTPCDEGTSDLFKAIGLGCPGDPEVTLSANGSNQALGVRQGFGPTDTWAPREGSSFAVLGSGFVIDLDMETPQGDSDDTPRHCNDPLGPEVGVALPPPIQTTNVAGDCVMNPELLGTGDCSNTVAEQFNQGREAFDYTEVRIAGEVPQGQNSLSYDFAFFTTEYPVYSGMEFNDMYIGWLESETWTGNISFDDAGRPISLNAGFLDFKDNNGTVVPEFAGTCMKRHAGTRWLSTSAPVTPGEQFTLVLAIFDMADAALDSYVFIDNWQWGCEGLGQPETTPVG